MNGLKKEIDRNRLLLTCFVYVFIWGLIAHGYAFANLLLSHDSLAEYGLADICTLKIGVGRFMNPLLRLLLGDTIVLPWLDGLFGLAMIALAVYFTARGLGLRTRLQLIAASGVFTVNRTVIACVATYMHDFASDMTALMLACLVFNLWVSMEEHWQWKKAALCALLTAIMLGFYQAYLSVTLVLMMIYCVLRLTEREKVGTVATHALKGIATLVVGGGLYLALCFVVCRVTGTALLKDNYNGITRAADFLSKPLSVFARIPETYISFAKRFLKTKLMPIHVLLAVLMLPVAIKRLRGLPFVSILAALLLVILMPPVMQLTAILSGVGHDLTVYAVWLSYCIVICLFDDVPTRPLRIAAPVLVGVMLVSTLSLGNMVYTRKTLVSDATDALMNRVVMRMEEQEGYVPGETEVAFIGEPNVQLAGVPDTDEAASITNAGLNCSISTYKASGAYFKYILQYPIVLSSKEKGEQLAERETVKAMPSWPAEGSVAIVDDVMIVKW